MKCAALACLLTLTACAPSDPPGMILPDERGHVLLEEVTRGDSPPFRLAGGDVQVFVASADKDISRDLLRECGATLSLIPYGNQEGARIPTDGVFLDMVRLNGVKPGVYFVRLDARMNYCDYFLSFMPVK